jgi:hypothetical protein
MVYHKETGGSLHQHTGCAVGCFCVADTVVAATGTVTAAGTETVIVAVIQTVAAPVSVPGCSLSVLGLDSMLAGSHSVRNPSRTVAPLLVLLLCCLITDVSSK